MNIFDKLNFYLISWLLTILSIPFLLIWSSNAADDLLRQIMAPAKDSENIIDLWENVNTVWNKVIKWSIEIDNEWIGSSSSMIVKVTRLLLILTIALSVTMILYNGMMYIIETWQWKEWKSLIKNVIFIVVGIFISLFSVVIINLIQSIPTTLDEELQSNVRNKTDNEVLKGKKIKWWHEMNWALKDLFHDYKYWDFSKEECNKFKERDYFMYNKYCIPPSS